MQTNIKWTCFIRPIDASFIYERWCLSAGAGAGADAAATAFAVADEETISFNIYKGRKISFAHLTMFALKSSDYPSFMDGLPTQSIRRSF